ncbi:MAG TPA: hypothetical protein VL053_05395 [Arachidicoccus sp.]|nr:hypothetical protein [Arachidicoccus sp.]
METLNKEQIKSRMIKTAARLWNIPENEIENSFDPLVLLMVEACAGEMEKIGFEINRMQAGLLEKFTELMVPQSLLGAKPASCVASAIPLENAATIDEHTSFTVVQNIQVNNKATTQNFLFTPIGKFVILKARQTFLCLGKKIFKLKENGTKELHYSLSDRANNQLRELYILLDTDIASLEGMNIFFDLLNHPHPDGFYNALAHAKILAVNTQIITQSGYYQKSRFDIDMNDILLEGAGYIAKVNKYIASLYSQKFIHVSTQQGNLQKSVPQELLDKFPPEVFENPEMKNCVFLKIQFNRNFFEEELDGLNCFVNAFPVINKEHFSQNYVTDKWINIIPLQSEKYFLDLNEITSADGTKYNHRISSDSDVLKDGYATVRNNGISKPDSANIRSMIAGLINNIHNESSFFSELNNDFLLSCLNEISITLSRIEDQLSKSSDTKKSKTYILLKPKTEGEKISICYYTTDAENAHQILPYSHLTPYNHLLTNLKDNYIVSKVVGGKTLFSDNERRTILKQQLFSKDKIVSAQDVKLLCLQFFADKLIKVEVKKGYEIGSTPQSGLNRTLEIHLTLNNILQEEADYCRNEILLHLNQRATLLFPFKLIYKILPSENQPR